MILIFKIVFILKIKSCPTRSLNDSLISKQLAGRKVIAICSYKILLGNWMQQKVASHCSIYRVIKYHHIERGNWLANRKRTLSTRRTHIYILTVVTQDKQVNDVRVDITIYHSSNIDIIAFVLIFVVGYDFIYLFS